MTGENIGISKDIGIPSSRASVQSRVVSRTACQLSQQPVAQFFICTGIYSCRYFGVLVDWSEDVFSICRYVSCYTY